MMCTAKGSASIVIKPAPAVTNRADTKVALTFSDDNDTMLANWTRTAIGAGGVDYRRWLRNLDTRERKQSLDRLCGASGSIDVTAAGLPDLEKTSSPFKLSCEIEESSMNIGENTARYGLPVMGPWFIAAPEFTAATRVHPIVFDYPTVEVTGIDVTAPHGFKTKTAPAPVKLESPYGRYQLFVTETPAGYHVDRAFALTVLIAQAKEYEALRKFLADVRNADRATITFERIANAK